MQQKYQYKQFTFSNGEAKLIAALDCILLFIGKAVNNSVNCKDILLRSKWIVTELLTNALKHSGNNVICFEIEIRDEVLQITKSDGGEPFSLLIDGERKSYPAGFTEKDTYLLHEDDLSILYATITDNALIFSAEDNIEAIDITVQELNEHFGLSIITRASDKFIYRYDSRTRTNFFTASLLL